MSEDDSVKNEWNAGDIPSPAEAVIAYLRGRGPQAETSDALSLPGIYGILDAVVDRLNAHYPKYQPYDQGGVRGADSLLYRAERAERQRDEWKARAEAAERELADEYSEANQKAAAWDRIRAHPALRRNLLPDVEGSYADLVFERITWLAEVAETVTELQSAPAVTRDDIEKAIRYEFLDWEGQMEARISRAVNQTWNLVSGADPAVHVVRESDLPAARVDGDDYLVKDPKGDYRWPKHGASWWEDRAQDALTKAARFTALARLAAREAVVGPVEAQARELWEATREGGAPVAAWADAHEDAQAQFRVLARHVLGQEATR